MTKIILFLLSSLLVLSLADQCSVADQNGINYDISGLKKEFQVQDPLTSASALFGIQYIFNPCDEVHSTCSGNSVFEVLQVMGTLTETCEIVGKPDQKTINQTTGFNGENVIEMVWPGGDMCIGSENPAENMLPKKAQFQIICDPIAQNEFAYAHIDGVKVTRCSPMFTIRHPAGCKPGFLGGKTSFLGSFFYWVFLVGIVYLIVGVAYNWHKNGKRGIEAIPNLEFWQNFPEHAQTFGKKSYDVMLDVGEKVKYNIGNLNLNMNVAKGNQPYTTV